jgi:hypothetical protein
MEAQKARQVFSGCEAFLVARLLLVELLVGSRFYIEGRVEPAIASNID